MLQHKFKYYKISGKVSGIILGALVVILFMQLSCRNKNSSTTSQTPEITDTAFNKALAYAERICDSGYVDRSMLYLDSAYHEIDPDNIADDLNYLHYNFVAYYRDKKNYVKAGYYADSMINLILNNKQQKKMPRRLVAAYFSKGDAYLGMHKYAEAFYNFFHANAISKGYLNPCDQLDFTYHLGMVLYQQERYLDALDNFKQSYVISNICDNQFNDFYRRQEVLDNIGLCFLNTKSYDSALHYFSNCLDYINKGAKDYSDMPENLFNQARAVIYGNMASAYIGMKQPEKAKELLINSININSIPGNDLLDAQLSKLKLCGLYLSTRDMDKIPAILASVNTVIDSLPDSKIKKEYYRQMWHYYDATENLPLAYKYQSSYLSLQDSLKQQLHALYELDLMEHFKMLEKENQISFLEKDDAAKRNYLVIALLSSILSLIIIFLLFENWRKSNKNLKAQEILNDKIAEQNKKQEKLLQDLEHSNKEKDRILRAVAHDIRNPLGAIAALNHMLSENLKDTSDENKELMSLINNATSDTLALSQDILQASHNLKNLPLELEDVLVQKLVNNSVHLLQFKAKEKKQKIEVKLPEQPVYVHVNREKISRVLDNLISNAIKFSYEGATIIVSAGVKGSKVVIQVADSGVGIPNHFKHKVFDIFTEAKRLGTSGEKPFGLGLSISRQIVEAHGGEIWFESSEGKGSVFSFSLPG